MTGHRVRATPQLKGKAIQLLRRERELSETRRRLHRTRSWLQAIQLMTRLAMPQMPAGGILSRWARLMIRDLHFNAAVVLELEPATSIMRTSVAEGAEASLVSACPCPPTVLDLLSQVPEGISNGAEDGPRAALGAAVGMSRFMWFVLFLGEASHLVLAVGYTPATAPFFPPLDQAELRCFQMMGQHVEILQRNQTLMEELVQERHRLQALNQNLESLVTERTSALQSTNEVLSNSLRALKETQEQLLHAGKMAAVGTLIAGLSHELNNPIGVIRGYAQGLLRLTPEEAPTRKPLLGIERQSLRCAHLVKSLLAFSRRGDTAREPVAVDLLLDGTLSLATSEARRLDVTLSAAPCDGRMPPVWVCVPEIESALLNLINNAIDATPRGGSVVISARALTWQSTLGVEIAVTDTGAGIPADLQDRVFDPFFTTKPVGAGTGLGLSLTRTIIENHGGRLQVESQPERGTTVRLWLPAETPQTGELREGA